MGDFNSFETQKSKILNFYSKNKKDFINKESQIISSYYSFSIFDDLENIDFNSFRMNYFDILLICMLQKIYQSIELNDEEVLEIIDEFEYKFDDFQNLSKCDISNTSNLFKFYKQYAEDKIIELQNRNSLEPHDKQTWMDLGFLADICEDRQEYCVDVLNFVINCLNEDKQYFKRVKNIMISIFHQVLISNNLEHDDILSILNEVKNNYDRINVLETVGAEYNYNHDTKFITEYCKNKIEELNKKPC